MRTRSRRFSPDSRRKRTALVLVTCALLPAAVSPSLPYESPLPREAAPGLARDVLSGEAYQTELPPTMGTPHIDPPDWWVSVVGPLGGLTAVLLYALAAGVVLLLLVWAGQAIVRHSGIRRRRAPATVVERNSGVQESVSDPGRMAERGLYKEAIHGLLLLAIRNVSRSEDMAPARSWTSRELARRLPMKDQARGAFRQLVTMVEGSHFGVLDVGQEHYRLCLRHYRVATGEVAE